MKTLSKVLMIVQNQYFEHDRRVRQEAYALVDEGFQVCVIAPKEKGKRWVYHDRNILIYHFPIFEIKAGVWGYVLEFGWSFIVIFLLSMWIWIRHGFDVVHCANPPDIFVILASFFQLFGKKYIYDHHDLSPELYLIQSKVNHSRLIYKTLYYFEKISCKRADLIIEPNTSYERLDMERHGVPKNKIVVVRNAPDLDRIPAFEKLSDVSANNKPIICFVGMMAIQDGLDNLIFALSEINTRYPQDDFECWLIGRGSYEAQIHKLVNSLSLQNKVKFFGFMKYEDMLSYVFRADIGVEPCSVNDYTENCTMVKVMDYMVLGKPVVAFDTPETRNTAGEAALYAEPNDVQDFAEKLVILMRDPCLRQELGKIGRCRVIDELQWKKQAINLINGYRALFNGKA